MSMYKNKLYVREKADDPMFQYMQDRLYEEVVKEFDVLNNDNKNKTMLDVGCGIGGLIPHTGVLRYYGIDISLPNIEYIKDAHHCVQNDPEVDVRNGDITGNLPYVDHMFDYVVCTEVFEHLSSEIELVLKEIKRVAKRGARIVITVPSNRYLWAYLPWRLYPFRNRLDLGDWSHDVIGEEYNIFHARFKPDYIKKLVSKYFWIEKVETTFWYNNRIIHGWISWLQMMIHKLSWRGETGLGNNMILRCRKL